MKNNKLYEAFINVKDHTLNTLVFELPDIITRTNISKHKGLKENSSDKAQYFGTGRYRFDIPIGVEFDVIFSRTNPQDYMSCRSILEWVNVNHTREIDYLPAGYSGVCLIEFSNGKPEILSRLAEFGDDKRQVDYDVLYLTTQDVMNRILENLNETVL